MKLADIPENTNDLYKWISIPHWCHERHGPVPIVAFHWGIFMSVTSNEIRGDSFGTSWGISLSPSTIGEELGFQP